MCTTCDETGLIHGDVIEIEAVNDAYLAANYKLPTRTRALILKNDDYFEHCPDLHTNDASHLCVVTQYNEPFSIYCLLNEKLVWRKLRHTTPDLRDRPV